MFAAKIAIVALSFAVALHASPAPSKPIKEVAKKVEAFKPFTGKVLANKVRVRIKPDLESHVFRQVSKNDLLLIVGEEGDFFAVQPPKDAKAYVFRSYILDNVVEANRVNVRLEPHVDGPIIGQLQAGDKIKGHVASMNNKWIEMAPPASTKFYVSKEFIGNVGGPDYLISMEKKRGQVGELLHNALLNAETESKKIYEDMAPQPIIEQFQTIIRNFPDFAEANQAKEALVLFKDAYLQKKITYLEDKAQLSSAAKDELLARHKAENQELFTAKHIVADRVKKEASDEIQFWNRIEEGLYLSWTAFHTGRKVDDFYAEQKANATILSGTVEVYDHPVRNRPGDWILRGEESPIAYLYSTVVDLQKYEGKHVTLLVAPRPNNHFAFPAYYVLSIE